MAKKKTNSTKTAVQSLVEEYMKKLVGKPSSVKEIRGEMSREDLMKPVSVPDLDSIANEFLGNEDDEVNAMGGLKKMEDILKLARLVITDEDNEFKFGNVVFDKRNSEFGIVLCKKPVDMTTRDLDNGSVRQQDTYLVLTLSEDTRDSSEYRHGVLLFRIRYVSESFIQPLDDTSLVESDNGFSKDLKTFCGEQCFMTCSPSCALYKHSNKVSDEEI